MKSDSEGHKSSSKIQIHKGKILLKPRSWVNLGYSIANSEKETFFLKNAIPGETVDAVLLKRSGSLFWGVASEIQEVSSERISSDCSIFPRCGGCSYRHVSYQKELEIKKFLLQETLEHFLSKKHIQIPEIEVLSGDSNGYRNTAQIQLGFAGNKRLAGFYEEFSHSIVNLPEEGCKNLPQEMNFAFAEFLKQEVKGSKQILKSKTLSFRLEGTKVISYKKKSVNFSENIRIPELKKIVWEIPAGGFSQVNRYLIAPWLEKIFELVPNNQNRILELYCGSGLIAIALKSKATSWLGYEISSDCVQQAKRNVLLNGISSCDFKTLNLETDWIDSEGVLNSSFWIMNPPRAGLSKKVLQTLIKTSPNGFLYSSCNHSTLVRDLSLFLNKDYKLSNVTLVDFFPRTKHFEVIVKVEKKD
ncbi:methyltransferase [Leptospira interrogans]|uniref:Class I SAM-dependent RNA methyltransferase n=2 Tax=Leptospira interrogans TaxID=173 RepID=A0AA40WEC9_LEPIR|nr:MULTISPECIES: methyltransferase [Leptospira]EJO79727.1 ribosomal protein L11 methyltransferase-like protein [Leptospira interrogans serovar Pomona str. Kennewicki LC82-25]EKN97911.1 ribosomal protein L11 methyltransferase-like protein [Leptospira interrogans serovar Pomona str. Pomona]EMF32286.1 ribosomal protein L11 methyltransferase-like protein [Leptospira interrogans serovar Pomona str. Fox 32256]EMI71229.1 ribosomal protein L11 methyltransferase-like protein [Leptospira interrogans sero